MADFQAQRRKKARQRVGAAVADALGVTVEGIDEIVGGGTDILEPDEWGRWNGTDFAFKIRRVWWAFVDLLVESGRIERAWIEDADMADRGEQSRLAKELLFPE